MLRGAWRLCERMASYRICHEDNRAAVDSPVVLDCETRRGRINLRENAELEALHRGRIRRQPLRTAMISGDAQLVMVVATVRDWAASVSMQSNDAPYLFQATQPRATGGPLHPA